MKKARKILTAFLIILSVVLTTGTFAYWANYVEGTQTEALGTINIGSATSASTVFELSNKLNSGGYLVPMNQVLNSGVGAVEVINFVHAIKWNEVNEISQLNGSNTQGLVGVQHKIYISQNDDILPIEDYADIYTLINVIYSETNPSVLYLNDKSESFSYKVTMDEPQNIEQYQLIANSNIVIEFLYTIKTENIQTIDIDNTEIFLEETSEKFFVVSRTANNKIIDYDIEGGLDVVIPSIINNVSITSIGDNSFLRAGIDSVVIPDGVTYIGTNAFNENNLETVVIPSSVKLISYNAFYGNNLTEVTFEEGLEVIRQGAFADNFITKVTLPSSVVEVKSGAFGYGGNFITEITIGENVTIGNSTSFGWYGSSFRSFYNQEKQAGTYIYTNGEWSII